MKGRTRIRSKVVEPRTCKVCGEPYTPRFEEQEACGGRCSRVWGGRQHIGKCPAHFARAAQGRREKKRRAIQATCRERWPEMSVREIEIFEFAMRTGYDRGYSKGATHQRRQRVPAA